VRRRVKESGVCHCGADMTNHAWDNHAPLDMVFPADGAPAPGFWARRREELDFLWNVTRTVTYAIFKGMW
jgi:hypothetical protein